MTCQKISEILQGSQLDDQSDIFIAPAPGIWVLVPPPPIPTGDHPSSPPLHVDVLNVLTFIIRTFSYSLIFFLGKIPSQPFPQVIFHVKISDIFHLINIPMSNSSYVRQGKFQVRFFGHFLHALTAYPCKQPLITINFQLAFFYQKKQLFPFNNLFFSFLFLSSKKVD